MTYAKLIQLDNQNNWTEVIAIITIYWQSSLNNIYCRIFNRISRFFIYFYIFSILPL